MLIENYFNPDNVDDLIVSTLNNIHLNGPISMAELELLSYMKKFHSEIFSKYEKKLIFVLGLFYKTSEPESILEEVYEIQHQVIIEETGRNFTPVQANAYKKIIDKTYFSFSAPTSSGKSFLFRELIKNETGDIVIILPSRALIAEYIFTIKEILKGDTSILILQFVENVNILKTRRRIFVITPERSVELFSMIDKFNIQLILLDEAQISEEFIRGMKFDSFVRRIDKKIPNAKKVFSHPFISNPEAQLQKHGFLDKSDSANYKQLSVGKIYLSESEGSYSYFSPYLDDENFIESKVDVPADLIRAGGTILIYVSKTSIYDDRYMNLFRSYIDLMTPVTDAGAIEIISELQNFIGATDGDKKSTLIQMMYMGVVIHHGSIPLYGRLLIEKFVNYGFAKICFSTSTLSQGINMPFDVVWIHNYRFNSDLELKNLIGRAGRTSSKKNSFDYGYVIVNYKNVNSFKTRVAGVSTIKPTSVLSLPIESVGVDSQDVVEAIQNDSFNIELNLTDSQVARINNGEIDEKYRFVLDTLMGEGQPIRGNSYYGLSDGIRTKVKSYLKEIFILHLRRKELSKVEQTILSTSIPILLWQIQGKSFNEVVSLRHSYITQKSERLRIKKELKSQGILPRHREIIADNQVFLQRSFLGAAIPNSSITGGLLFPNGSKMADFKYDKLVFDTYDYLDKVISQSLSDPLCAAFKLYYDRTKDIRALTICNYIRYGTNDQVEIWLLKYGFGFEEIEWILPHVEHIDENEIIFYKSIESLEQTKLKIIERYI